MINLLPLELKQERAYTKQNSLLARYIVVVIAIVGLALATLIAGSYLLHREEEQLDQRLEQKQLELAAAAQTANEARELSTKIDTVGQLLSDEVKFSQLVPAIAALIPEQANLTSLSLTADTSTPLTLIANVDDQSTAAVMRANIEDSELFAAADIVSISPGAGSGEVVTIQALFSEELPL